MTGNSIAVLPVRRNDQTGISRCPADHLSPAIASAVTDHYPGGEWNPERALAFLKRDVEDLDIAAEASLARRTLTPCDHGKLIKRLQAVGSLLAPNRSPQDALVWVHEMARLLGDLPEDIACEALDGHLSGCKFLPTVAEIRERAEPKMAERRRQVFRVEALERLVRSGADIPPARHRPLFPIQPEPFEEATKCTPEQAAAILDEFGLKPESRERISLHRGPPRMPTKADYIAMGVDPSVFEGMPDA